MQAIFPKDGKQCLVWRQLQRLSEIYRLRSVWYSHYSSVTDKFLWTSVFFIFLDCVINQNDTAIGQTNKCCLVKKLSVATCSNRREGQHHENRDKSVFVETHSDNITLVLFFKKEVRQKRQRLVGAGGTNWSAGGHLKSWAKKWTTHITRGPGKCSSRGPAALSHYSALPQRSNGGWDGAEPHTGHRGCN